MCPKKGRKLYSKEYYRDLVLCLIYSYVYVMSFYAVNDIPNFPLYLYINKITNF